MELNRSLENFFAQWSSPVPPVAVLPVSSFCLSCKSPFRQNGLAPMQIDTVSAQRYSPSPPFIHSRRGVCHGSSTGDTRRWTRWESGHHHEQELQPGGGNRVSRSQQNQSVRHADDRWFQHHYAGGIGYRPGRACADRFLQDDSRAIPALRLNEE